MILRVLVVLLLLSACGRKLWQAPDPNAHADALTAILEANEAPGISARVQTPKGDWVGVRGDAVRGNDLSPSRALDKLDRFGIRDVTTAYVATAILILADDGALRLDDKISRYVPNVPRGDDITLRHLAGMRSGLADYTERDPFLTRSQTGEPATAFELLQQLDPALHFEPGTAFEWSRTNAILLGEVINVVTGQTWFDFVHERMLDPLRLFRTEYPNGVTPSEPFSGGVHGEARVLVDFSLFGSAAGMASTLEELSTFGRALAEGAYVSAFMQSERVALRDGYGLGIAGLSGMLGHSGHGFGYSAAVFHEPGSDMTITVLINSSNTTMDAEAVVKELALAMGFQR